MRVEVKKLLDFLKAEEKPFSIPLFQRPYSWDEWQCEEMWRDVMRDIDAAGPHFFGAIFVSKDACSQEKKVRSIIDGQQRTLTTLLLLSTLAERTGDDSIVSRISAYKSPDIAERLTSDRALANKAFFTSMMNEPGFDPNVFLYSLDRFEVVEVELEEGDDGQAIFESFNSKGVPLVSADMIRNYLLLTEDPKDQERLYLNYWEPMQGLFGDDPGSLRMNNALRAWTVIRCKTPKSKSDSECFRDFKQYFLEEYKGSIDDLMDELLSFGKVWAQNYRYHAVKKYRSANWAKIGRKTLVSGRKRKKVSKEVMEFYAKHYGIDFSGED